MESAAETKLVCTQLLVLFCARSSEIMKAQPAAWGIYLYTVALSEITSRPILVSVCMFPAKLRALSKASQKGESCKNVQSRNCIPNLF